MQMKLAVTTVLMCTCFVTLARITDSFNAHASMSRGIHWRVMTLD